ncbi:HEAT repeat domain-containing protein [Taibaiella lutea]|uniref:HEAT repeat domain-containing protein n=1 Tax=Taibaiella lutea TaxID=2608001 RepID=A0A5M6CAI0_9BACT|nr:HEAT repeat domain-containing protein [Taibaiella lutea]KAA5532178.1 HEAT repeat domain-containing protein [Taibaiella lutea]
MPDILPVNETGEGFTIPYFDQWMAMPVIIRVAVVFIGISTIFILYIQFRIWFTRYKGYLLNKRVEKVVPVIDALIAEEIFMKSETGQKGAPHINFDAFRIPLFANHKNKQILIDRLINYRRSFSGSIGNHFKQLYLELGLDKLSTKKMNRRSWNMKVRGIRELTGMDVSISDVNILPLTNSKRHELRTEARNAYIKLSKNEPFKFFDISSEPLLDWDQIELFKTITTTENIAIPNFARWVTYSNNKSIISFCLKLIVHYNQQDAAPAVIKLLETKDHILRAEAINCLGKLKYEPAEAQLRHIYSNQPLNCQLEILKAIGRMSTGESAQFLRQEFMYSTDFDIRKNAAMSFVRNASPEYIDELMEASNDENKLILKHSMNPLIKY